MNKKCKKKKKMKIELLLFVKAWKAGKNRKTMILLICHLFGNFLISYIKFQKIR